MEEIQARDTRSQRYGLVLSLLFLAGFSGLVYEVVWTRILTLTFGGTVFATSAVLCAFMGGLALGSWVAGKWVDRHRSPLLLFATVQFTLGVFGLGLMPLFSGLTRFYVFTYQALHPGFYTLTSIRFIFSVLVLLVPAALIAAVFPIIIKIVISARSRVGRGVALVYGVDTLGAVTGAAMAGFVLLPVAGVTATVHVAVGLNFVVSLLAFLFHKRSKAAWAETPSQELEAVSPDFSKLSLSPRATRVLLGAFAVSGAAALSYQVLVTKVLVHALSMHIYAVSTMLACFLFGLGAGSLLCMRLLRRPRSLLYWFALTEAGIGLIGFSLPLQFVWLRSLIDALTRAAHTTPSLGWYTPAIACFAVLLVPTLLMGATLPLLAPVLTPNLRRLGRSVGSLYAVNTLGAVGGVLFTTFLVLPFVGFKTGMIIAGCLNLLVAFVALHYSYDRSQRLRWRTALAVLTLGALVLTLTVRSSLLPVMLTRLGPGYNEQDVVFFKEGATGTVAVMRMEHWRMGGFHQIIINGTTVGGSDLYALRTFQILGNMPFFLHQDHSRPKRVLVLGLGMGITLGTVLDQNPQSVTVVEIVPEVLEASPWFAAYNHNALDNPKVKVYIEDARNFLLATDQKFDIVLLDATSPESGDSWVLYTQECYQLVKRVLKPDGIAAQWVPMQKMTFDAYWSILRTVQSVFPHLTLWSSPTSDGYSVWVAPLEPSKIDFAYLQSRMADPMVRRNFEAAEIPDEYALLSYFTAGEETLMKHARLAPLNTDDLAPVQFSEYVKPGSAFIELYLKFTSIKENPLPLLFNLGSTPEEATACAQRISRTHEASVLARKGYISMWSNQQAQARRFFQKAYELNPYDPDTALYLGLTPRRPHTKADLP